MPKKWLDSDGWNLTFMIGGAIASLAGFWLNLLHVAPEHAGALWAATIAGCLSLLAGCIGLLRSALPP